MKAKNSTGMSLMELLLGTIIIMILLALLGFQVRGLVQRAKVSAAKATIDGLALCLKMIKDDTGLYPEALVDIRSPSPPSDETFSFSGWSGPYGRTVSLTDPWRNPYFYELQDLVFGPKVFERETGQPQEETFAFDAIPGTGMLVVANPGITSGSITLNGEEIVTQNEFKNVTPAIVKTVNLLAANTITIRLTSSPGLTIRVSISASQTSKNATFTLGSYGKNGQEGGVKYDADIVYGTF